MVAKAEVSAAPACLDFTACSVYVAGDDEANRKGGNDCIKHVTYLCYSTLNKNTPKTK